MECRFVCGQKLSVRGPFRTFRALFPCAAVPNVGEVVTVRDLVIVPNGGVGVRLQEYRNDPCCQLNGDEPAYYWRCFEEIEPASMSLLRKIAIDTPPLPDDDSGEAPQKRELEDA
jgi:hypothetical protein